MTSSSYTWAGRKLTPQELISSQRTDPLPHIVKLTQVPSEYEKSCPQMANGTVLWLYGSAEEERVALKTSDKNPKYISVPLETPIKFEVVHTHEHGPPTLLSSMLRGKVQSDLKVEMAGNAGNRLSPTPDQTQSVPYGSLQVVGIYKEGVLQAQTIINVAGELNPLRRNLSVNCPVHLDIATGLYGKSAEEFQKLKERLKKNQSSKATNQTETSYDLVLLTNPPKSSQDFSHLQRICHLHSHLQGNTTASTPGEETSGKPATTLGQALQQLTKSSKQENIPLVDKKSSRKSMFLPNGPSSKPSNPTTNEATYDDGMSNLGKNWIKSGDPKFYYVTIDAPKVEPSEYANEPDKRASYSKSSPFATNDAPGVYLNGGELVSPEVKEKLATAANSKFGSQMPSPATHLPVLEEYENAALPDQTKMSGIKATEVDLARSQQPTTSAPSVSQTSKANEIAVQLEYEEIPAARDYPSNATTPSCKRDTPLPPIPTTVVTSEINQKIKSHKSFKNPLIRKQDGGKRRSDVIPPDSDSGDDGDYQKPVEERTTVCGPRPPAEIPRTGSNRKWRTPSDIPKNVKEFSISDISLCLELLKLHEYVDRFREKNVDGKLLLKLTKNMLMESFHMQEFEAKQLFEFAVKKWRPKK